MSHCYMQELWFSKVNPPLWQGLECVETLTVVFISTVQAIRYAIVYFGMFAETLTFHEHNSILRNADSRLLNRPVRHY
jgi:hypothetical protein